MKKIERDTFIIYRSFYESIQGLDKNIIADIFTAICEYSLNGKEIELNGIAKNIFILIKPQLEANNKKYLNGKQGGRPEKNWENSEKPKQNQNETKMKPNDNQNETKVKPNEEGIMNNDKGIMSNEEGIINNSEAEILEESTLLNIREDEEKEKSSAKKEKENYGREDINKLIESIKYKCNGLGVMYDKTKEREFSKHILTAKEFGENAEKCGMSRIDFALNILIASVKIKYWKGYCNGPMKIYQNYVDVYNQTVKEKSKNIPIIAHIN